MCYFYLENVDVSYSAKISLLVCFVIIVSFDFWLQTVKDWKVLYWHWLSQPPYTIRLSSFAHVKKSSFTDDLSVITVCM